MPVEQYRGHNAPFGKWVHWVLLGGPILSFSIGYALEESDYSGKSFAIFLGVLFYGLSGLAVIIYGVYLPVRWLLLKVKPKSPQGEPETD